MGRENVDNWSVSKCSGECVKCGRAFADRETLVSRLTFDDGAYIRTDFCEGCWNPDEPGLSIWKTVFLVPPPPQQEALRKENAESLLRRLIARENEEDLNAVFILMVMLERKKIFIERDIRRSEDGRKLRFYEHRKTGESFVVTDPGLKLDELEHVQEEVVRLLGGRPRTGPDADGSTAASAPAEEGSS